MLLSHTWKTNSTIIRCMRDFNVCGRNKVHGLWEPLVRYSRLRVTSTQPPTTNRSNQWLCSSSTLWFAHKVNPAHEARTKGGQLYKSLVTLTASSVLTRSLTAESNARVNACLIKESITERTKTIHVFSCFSKHTIMMEDTNKIRTQPRRHDPRKENEYCG